MQLSKGRRCLSDPKTKQACAATGQLLSDADMRETAAALETVLQDPPASGMLAETQQEAAATEVPATVRSDPMQQVTEPSSSTAVPAVADNAVQISTEYAEGPNSLALAVVLQQQPQPTTSALVRYFHVSPFESQPAVLQTPE